LCKAQKEKQLKKVSKYFLGNLKKEFNEEMLSDTIF
jgi:hypothetical protein